MWWRRCNGASGGWRNVACHLKPSQTFKDAQLRVSCRAASPTGSATAPPTTAWLFRGWCGLHNALPGANYLPSRTPTAPDVTGRPKRFSRTTTTRATACSRRYHPEGEVSTGASKLRPRDWKTASIFKQPSLTERLLPTYRLEIIGHFNNVYISCITHFICIYCILYHLLHLSYAALTFLIHIFICTYSYSIPLLRLMCIR